MSRLRTLACSLLLIALAALPSALRAQTVSINAVTDDEQDTGTVDFVFTVSLDAPSAADVLVDYTTVDETAVSGVDYIPAVGTLTIPAGQLSTTLTVEVIGETIWEADETFKVLLGGASATGGPPQESADGRGTIVNDDPVPAASVSDCFVLEGDTADLEPGECEFTVFLTNASASLATFDFTTADLGAIAGIDYESTSGQFQIAPGETSTTVGVAVFGDDIDEPDETFILGLTAATGAVFADSQGLGTIQDNDPTPSLSIDDVGDWEGDSGTKFFRFTVSLSSPSSRQVSFSFDTTAGSATGSVDYFNISGQKFIPAGQTSTTISVEVVGDTDVEGPETFFVNLSSPVNATIARAQGTGTIWEDEPGVTIDDISLPEGDSGSTDWSFAINLTVATTLDVSVDYQTQNDTAMAGLDFIAISGTAVIPAGETSTTVPVTVLGDTVGEGDETFTFDLTGAINADILDSRGVVTIQDDDPAAFLFDSFVLEGDAGTGSLEFFVEMTPPSLVDTFLEFQTIDGTALAGEDYLPVAGTAFIPAGDAGVNIGVPIVGDTIPEPDETFTMTLTSISGADVARGIALGTIQNDDIMPTLTISDTSQVEGDNDITVFEFFIDVSDGSQVPISVQVFTESGTATETDYESHVEVLDFVPPELSRSVFIEVNGDSDDECDEEFFVRLASATNATILNSVGTGTILNDDALGCANPDGDCAADPACGGSDCDEGDPDTYPEAPEVNDTRDNQCPGDPGHGSVDEISGIAGFLDPLDPDRFSWPAQVGATVYEVLRGDSPLFDGACWLVTTNATEVTDADPIELGGGRYYVVSPAEPNAGDGGQRSDLSVRTFPCLGE